jgi:hypothetical protein
MSPPVRRLPLAGLAFFGFLPWLAAQEAPRDYAHLGVFTEAVKGEEASGVRISYVIPGCAAEAIGLRAGDEIIALNDVLLTGQQSFSEELRREKVGSTLRFLVRRGAERIRLRGKIGSYRAYQEVVRRRSVGKPLFAMPPLKWWDPENGGWVEKKDAFEALKGKITVVISFDHCNVCVKDRLQKIAAMHLAFKDVQPPPPFAFIGIYFREPPPPEPREKAFEDAKALFEKVKPLFPVAVACYDEEPTNATREQHVFLQNHGVAILDPQGNVHYLQILGIPEQEFFNEYHKLIKGLLPGAAEPGETAPPGRKN